MSEMKNPDSGDGFSYDVAFSYAGEDREYVERVAEAIEDKVRLFYDRYEQADLWGRNLHTHLEEIYGKKSRFCVMFISKHYAEKVWTNHEREIAQARAFTANETYILPARLDDTEIPGVLPTVGSIDLRSLTPEQLGGIILEKLGSPGARDVARAVPPWRRRWLVVAPAAALVAGWMGLSLVSEARGPRGRGGGADAGVRAEVRADSGHQAATGAGPVQGADGRVEQVVRADGSGSRTVLDGGMRINRRSGGGSLQKVEATNGGNVIINGGMDYTGP